MNTNIEETQKSLEQEVNSLNRHAGEIIIRILDEQDPTNPETNDTMHDVLQERADKRIAEREHREFNNSKNSKLLTA